MKDWQKGALEGAAAAIGAVVAAPLVLGAAGFGSAGIAAGSLTAAMQGPAVASGSAFAVAQSVGAAGLAIGTKAAAVATGADVGAACRK
jgi:hypothetical protein